MTKLKIAIASMCSIPGDLQGNLEQISLLASQSGQNHCDVLLTPEMSATGYGGYPEIVSQGESAGDGPIYQQLKEAAQQNDLVILAGFVELFQGKRFIAHYIVYPDGRYVVQRKHRVTPREYPLDSPVQLYFDDREDIGHVHPGEGSFVSFMIKGIRCSVVICADWGIPFLEEIFSEQKTQLVFLPVGAGGSRKDVLSFKELSTVSGMDQYVSIMDSAGTLSKSLKECYDRKRGLAAVNLCGFDGHSLYHGGSGSLVGPRGELACVLPPIPVLERQRTTMTCGEIFFDHIEGGRV